MIYDLWSSETQFYDFSYSIKCERVGRLREIVMVETRRLSLGNEFIFAYDTLNLLVTLLVNGDKTRGKRQLINCGLRQALDNARMAVFNNNVPLPVRFIAINYSWNVVISLDRSIATEPFIVPFVDGMTIDLKNRKVYK